MAVDREIAVAGSSHIVFREIIPHDILNLLSEEKNS